MADDNPYFLDFLFNNITNVQFNSTWMVVSGFHISIAPVPPDPGSTLQCSFPGLSGGTPGLNVIFETTPYPGSFAVPHVISANDLKRKLQTLAGAPIVGFSMAQQLNPTRKELDCAIFVSCSGALGKKFTARLRGIAQHETSTNWQLGLGLYKNAIAVKKVVKQIMGFGTVLDPFPDTFVAIGGSGEDQHDYVVDPVKRTIT